MIEHQGVWLPDGETHFQQWMSQFGEIVDGRGTYQIRKLRTALGYVKQWRTAIDVGAHVGLWSMQLAKKFALTIGFEPVRDFELCYARNLADAPNDVVVYSYALGRTPGIVNMQREVWDSGGTHVQKHGAGPPAEQRILDSFGFENVDFLKIDVEGYEGEVIAGAIETIRRWKPCICVEQKPRKLAQNYKLDGHPAVDTLLAEGAKLRAEMSGDYILSWD